MNAMNFIDSELLKNNCANDLSMMRELVNMGLLSINNSMMEVNSSLESKDWDNLARVLHKLRPVLCYCGINSLTDELLFLEVQAKERKGLPEITAQLMVMIDKLQLVRSELEQKLSSLSS